MAINNHNVEDIQNKSNIIGANKKDTQLLYLARDFNNYLRLDSEPLLFALLKKGMPANVSAIFALSGDSINKKINRAIEQNIIPATIDKEFQLFMLNYKVNSYILQHFGDFFDHIDDTEISNFKSQDQANLLYRKLIEYAYQDKIVDEDFYSYLFGGDPKKITGIDEIKLRSFFKHADVCCGNNRFINLCVENNVLNHFDKLLTKSKSEIIGMIINASNKNEMLMDECMPDHIRLYPGDETDPQKVDVACNAFAEHIFKEKETRYATRCLMLRLSQYNGEEITTFDDSGDNAFNKFKGLLVDFCDENTSTTRFLMDATVDGETFNIEKHIIRDYMEQLQAEIEANDPDDVSNPHYPHSNIIDYFNFPDGFDQEDFIRIFTVIQRLYYMASEYKLEVITNLLLGNYRSAYDIIKMGKAKFTTSLKKSKLATKIILQIYNLAEIKVNKVMALLNKYSQPANNVTPSVVKPKNIQEGDTPNISVMKMPELETLFGNQDITDTKHCESVLGPAAYLVDLLNLLDQIELTSDENSSLFDVLKTRRPDIEQIPLNCQNALTLVPYIDLVIEILEYHAADLCNKQYNESIFDLENNFSSWDTISDAENLEAEPDHCFYEIYNNNNTNDRIEAVIDNYTWKQPSFNLENEELRLYTTAMNLNRASWAELTKTLSNGLVDPYFDILGLNIFDKNIFTDEAIVLDDIQTAYNNQHLRNILHAYEDSGNYYSEFISIPDDTPLGGIQRRVEIKNFLNITGLTLPEFKALLDSYFINPVITPEFSEVGYRYSIHFTKKIELKNAYLEFLTELQAISFIYAMYQFRRLQLATKWDIPLLDNILMHIHEKARESYFIEDKGQEGFGALLNFDIILKNIHIQKIGKIKKIQEDFNISNYQLDALFGKIRINEYQNRDPYFYWLFIDNNYSQDFKDSITAILNETYTPIYVNANIFSDDGSFHPFMKYVCNTLQLQEEEVKELEFLLYAMNGQPVINRDNIVDLIRAKELLSVLNISLKELKAYIKLYDHAAAKAEDQFSFSNIDVLIQLFADVNLFRQQEVTFEKTLYFVTGETLTDPAIAIPTDEEMDDTAKRIVSFASEILDQEMESNSAIRDNILNELIALQPVKQEVAATIADNYPGNENFSADNNFVDNVLNIISTSQVNDRQIRQAVNYLCTNVKNTKADLKLNLVEGYKSKIISLFNNKCSQSDAGKVLNDYLSIKEGLFSFINDSTDTIIQQHADTLKEYFFNLPFKNRLLKTGEINIMAEELLRITGMPLDEDPNPFMVVITEYEQLRGTYLTYLENLIATHGLPTTDQYMLMKYIATIPCTNIAIENSIIDNAMNSLADITGINDNNLLKDIIITHLTNIEDFDNEYKHKELTSYFATYPYKDSKFTPTEKEKIIAAMASITGESINNTDLQKLVDSYNSFIGEFIRFEGYTTLEPQQRQLAWEFFTKHPISDEWFIKLGKNYFVDDMINFAKDSAQEDAISILNKVQTGYLFGAIDAYINLDANGQSNPSITELNNYLTAILNENYISINAQEAILKYFSEGGPGHAMDLVVIKDKGKDIFIKKLMQYCNVILSEASNLLQFLLEMRNNFYSEVTDILATHGDSLINYFKTRPFIIDETINKAGAITVEKISEITGINQNNSNLSAIAEYLASKKGPGENSLINLLKNSAKINEIKEVIPGLLLSFRFANAYGINKNNVDNLVMEKTPINIYELQSTQLDFNVMKVFVILLQSSSYLVHPGKPFSFYHALDNFTPAEQNPIEYCKHFKWAEVIEDPANYYNLHLPDVDKKILLIKWLIEIGKLHELTINPLEAVTWLKWDNITIEDIKRLKAIAKEKLGIGTYRARVAKLRNELRNRQRDALVSFITKIEPGIDDVNDLFSYFLIDTQTTPAVSTSRIVQATLAIQLLIQRIQFNLEADITLDKSDENRWKWMSLYRVWEANRKIFLYPENWLEPELRDDKSLFFKELEKELTSNEITKETVEKAYHEYLGKVEKVANIEYCQMFNEEYENYSILHVIGRTPGSPHKYYYRKLVNESYWTPWEELGFDINSEHIMPIVIDDRLMVFWLEYTDEIKEPKDVSFVGNNDNDYEAEMPTKQLKLRINWSEYKNGEWSEKKMLAHTPIIEGSAEEYISKKAIRLISETGEENFIYILFSYVTEPNNNGVINFNNPNGFKYRVETFNNVELKLLTPVPQKFDFLCLPGDMSNNYQKVSVNDDDGIVSLYIVSQNGTPQNKQILDVGNDKALSLVYPHHYHDFCSQSPFIVEQERRSLVIIPVVKPVVNNSSSNKARRIADDFVNNYNGTIVHESSQNIPPEYTDENQNMVVYSNGDQAIYESTGQYQPKAELPKHKSRLAVHLGYHPYVGMMRRNVERYGVEGLLDAGGFNPGETDLKLLKARQANEALLEQYELSKKLVINGHEHDDAVCIKEKFEFDTRSAFGIYNWELFFHIPYMVANHFYTEGNYDEALKWIHYIFDPRETNTDGNGSGNAHDYFWKFKPFAQHNATKGVEDILFDTNMHGDSSVESNELDEQLEIWSNDPFKPHNVARMRIGAYMKATVMRYLDILVARGDQSFRVDTMESINEALQYYVIAAQILGKKPEILETSIIDAKPYSELNTGAMGNAVEFMEESVIKPENAAYLEKFVESNELEIGTKPFSNGKNMKNMVQDLYSKLQKTEKVYKLYFGIPKNDKMFRYWEVVGDRLFKIRNSLNIDGVKRSVSLFAPPIDPGMLAAAATAGLDIKALVNGQAGPATQYRFNVMLNMALQLCSEIKSLGSQLLSAYEKEDSEKISKLRAQHEILLSEKVTRIKEKAIEEAGIQIEQLDKQKETIDFRKKFYASREKRIKKEQQQLDFMDAALVAQIAASILQINASIIRLVPDIAAGIAGVFGSPTFDLKTGGSQLSDIDKNAAGALTLFAAMANHKSSRAGILAGHQRREEEWQFQEKMADKEYSPLKKQRLAAVIRKEMANYELENHKKQIQQSREAFQVMSTKYTNQELYNWMRMEIATLHQNAYDMAFRLAKQAEKAYDFELNPGGFSQFISPSHFDSKYEGLLAGEKLFQELKEMEIAYHEKNTRKYELTKNVSLALLDPQQVIALRETGSCEIMLPEILFDMDHPGHCNRRIKSVALTIPCVAGPYTSVSAELTLVSNQFKTKEQNILQGQPLVTSMATSSAENDNGMFQLNFNDERYLPFEGAGVDSQWALTLPNNVRQFDYDTISDVILTVQYTAENAGNRVEVENQLKEALKEIIEGTGKNFAVFVDVKSQFPQVFEELKTGNATLTFSKSMLPGFLQNETVGVKSLARFDDYEMSEITASGTFDGANIELDKFAGNSIPKNLVLVVQLSINQ